MLWVVHLGDERCHTVAACDLGRSETLGYPEALCGVHLPDAGLEPLTVPTGWCVFRT